MRNALCLLASLALALTLTAATASGGDDIKETGELFASVPVPAGLTGSAVQEAIVATLTGREWGVKSKDDQRVVGYLKHRSNEAKVTLVYDAAKVDIFCVGWQIDKKTGVREKPEQPKGWLKNIQSDLTKRFNRAATQK